MEYLKWVNEVEEKEWEEYRDNLLKRGNHE